MALPLTRAEKQLKLWPQLAALSRQLAADFLFFFSLGNLSSFVFVLLSVGYGFFFFFVCFDFDLFAAPNLGLIIMIMTLTLTLTMAMAMKTMMIKLLGCLIFCNLIEP